MRTHIDIRPIGDSWTVTWQYAMPSTSPLNHSKGGMSEEEAYAFAAELRREGMTDG